MGVAQLAERLPVEEKAAGAEPVAHPRFMELSKTVNQLICVFEEDKILTESGDGFTVSHTVSALATLYEKARNAVEFRAEHLVRRAAIERILKRRILLGENAQQIAENLSIELVWAKYIDSSLIDHEKGIAITRIINRYLQVKQQKFSGASQTNGIAWGMMLGLASSEIDETIVSPKKRTALIDFVYQAMRQKIRISSLSDTEVNIQIYIAVERAFAQADNALISYHLLQVIDPSWFTETEENVTNHIPVFVQNLISIHNQMNNPKNAGVVRYIRKRLPPYRLLRDFFLETKESEIRRIIENPSELETALSLLATKRYQEIGAKVRRGVVRSIIYIFLTKMVFALALEAPFDTFIEHRISYVPLVINLIFPPFLLYVLAGFITVPGSRNTKRLISGEIGRAHV